MTTPGATDLGRVLKRLLDEAGVTAREVGKRIGKSEAMVSRYLGGQNPPKPGVVATIVTELGLSGPDVEDALRLAEDLDKPRLVILRPGSATSQERWNEIQSASTLSRNFNGSFVPGPLQTERYARLLFEAAGQAPEVVERNVAGRMARWAAMDDPRYSFVEVTTEGALRHHVHSPTVMVEQCARIADRARRDDGGRVRVGIIPWTRPGAVFPLTSFTIFDDTAVVVGTRFGTAYATLPGDVVPFMDQFAQLCEWAVFGSDCAREVDRITEDYRRLDRQQR